MGIWFAVWLLTAFGQVPALPAAGPGPVPAAPATGSTTAPVAGTAPAVAVAGASPTTGVSLPVSARTYLHDEADIFNSVQRSRLVGRVRKLAQSTGCEVHVWTRVVASLEGFEADCESLFAGTVKEAGHYRIVLVVLGYESTPRGGSGRGKVYTAVGAGLQHVLNKTKLEGFLAKPGQKVTADSVLEGIEKLSGSLDALFARAASVAAAMPRTEPAEPPPGPSARLRIDLIGGIVAVIVVVLLYRRMTRCPQCGARLRKQVKILPAGAEGGRHTVRRTAKCFSCGYVRKGSLF
ncbi:MAG: TPM domain-containing protein [Candidatus Riflebacteria bacterium]|nr:TPM domain-containing protein [Candidatus Riflebacteria bacterium]